MAGGLIAAVLFAGLLGQLLWSFSGFWSFPDALPDAFSLRSWARVWPELWPTAATSLSVATIATILAVCLTIGCLEAEQRYGLQPGARVLWLLYLPLLMPQVAFLPGLRMLMIQGGAPLNETMVIAAHLVFVLPYVFLSLSGPYRRWDKRLDHAAFGLGASPTRVFWSVRLPMLLTPILTAAAIGLAVSIAQYLPTLLIGGGRVATLTTEALALSSGGNRRIIGAYAVAQTGLVILGFVLAIALPKIIWSNRRGMRGRA